MEPLTILLTGVGATGAYGVIKGLRANTERVVRIVGVDVDPQIASRYLVDGFSVVPRRDSPDFLPVIREITRRERVDLLLPVPTSELEIFATCRREFASLGAKVLVSEMPGLAIANNKERLYEHLAAHHLPCVPQFRTAQTYVEFLAAAETLGYPDRPVCMRKPCGMGAQGFRILSAHADRLDILLNRNPDSTTTTLADVARLLENAEPFPRLVVQEFLPGVEYDVDVLADRGRTLLALPRKNEQMLWGMSLISCVERQQEIIDLSTEIVGLLRLSYVVSLTFRYSQSGRPMIIEINPRIPGSIAAAVGAGANLPYLAVKLAQGEPFVLPEVVWGTRMIRYWEEMILGPAARATGAVGDACL